MPKPDARGGRPKLAADQRRSAKIVVSFKPRELAAIEARASARGQRTATAVRNAALRDAGKAA